MIRRLKRFNWISYTVMLYIIVASVWWALLLWKKNKETYDAKLALYLLEQEVLKDSIQYDLTYQPNYQDVVTSYERQKKMIQGESLFLLMSIILGTIFIFRANQERLSLAQRQKNFLLAVSHELKTPLTSIQLIFETFLIEKITEEQKKYLIESGLEENNRLKDMIRNMLLVTKTQYGKTFENYSIALYPILQKFELKYKKSNPNITFNYNQIAENQVVVGRQDDIEIIISNLIENAIKYSPLDRPINIFAQNDHGSYLKFSVIDEGKGISAEEKKNIFKMFYRIGDEETRQTSGVGLGLYVTKLCVKYIGGRIEVKDHSPKGSIFVVYFKKTKK